MHYDDIQLKIYGRILNLKPRKSDIRKIQILEATLVCIAKNGVDETNGQEVARLLKIRRSHVVYYYPERLDMIEAAIKLALAVAQEITVGFLAQAKTPEEKLISYIEGTVTWIELHPQHAAALALFYYYGCVHPRFRVMVTEIRDLAENRVLGVVQAFLGPKKQKVKPEHIKRIACSIRYLLMGGLLNHSSTTHKSSYTELKHELVQSALDLLQSLEQPSRKRR